MALPDIIARLRMDTSDLENAEGSAKKFSGSFGKVLAAGLLGVGALAAAGLAKAFSESLDIGAANDKLAAQLGLTAEESKRVGGIAGDLYANAYGDSLETVNGAVAAVISSIGGMKDASSEDLKAVTANALDFATAMDVDVAEAAKTAGVLVKTGLAKDAREAFDLLTVAAQEAGPAMVEPIMEAANEYGVNFNALGIGGRAAFAILVDASKGGEIALDKAGDAVKEFAIRATDLGDKGAQSALTDLGLSGRQMAEDLLAGGERASTAFSTIVTGLQGITNPADQAQASVALFGTPLEDISKDQIPAFLDAMAQAGGELENVAGASDRMGATLNDNAATNLEAFKRQVMAGMVQALGSAVPAVEAVARGLATGLGPALETVKGVVAGLRPVVEAVVAALSAFVGAIPTPILQAVAAVLGVVAVAIAAQALATAAASAATSAWGAVTALFTTTKTAEGAVIARGTLARLAHNVATVAGTVATLAASAASKAWAAAQWLLNAALTANPIGLLVAAVALLIGALVYAWRNSETFRAVVTGAFEAVKAVVSAVMGAVVAVVTGAWDGIKAVFGGALGFIRDAIAFYFNAYKAVVMAVLGAIRAVVSGAWDAISGVFGGALGAIAGVVQRGLDAVRGIFGAVFGALRGIVSDAVGNVLGVVSGIGGRITGALGNLGNLLVNAGRELMEGLARGIGEKIAAVIQRVKDAAQKIKDLLPGSPVKTGPLTSWNRGGAGKRLMGLLQDGIVAGTPGVQGALAGAVNVPDLSGALAGPSGGAAMAALAGAGPGAGGNLAGLLDSLLGEVAGLRADVRGLPSDYQQRSRAGAGV